MGVDIKGKRAEKSEILQKMKKAKQLRQKGLHKIQEANSLIMDISEKLCRQEGFNKETEKNKAEFFLFMVSVFITDILCKGKGKVILSRKNYNTFHYFSDKYLNICEYRNNIYIREIREMVSEKNRLFQLENRDLSLINGVALTEKLGKRNKKIKVFLNIDDTGYITKKKFDLVIFTAKKYKLENLLIFLNSYKNENNFFENIDEAYRKNSDITRKIKVSEREKLQKILDIKDTGIMELKNIFSERRKLEKPEIILLKN